ncbi:MAG: adaptor protein MecA [Ruminococcaceae bacterium]|nr:adaptor protein MecA [Oscillospiraceae bacterium]
MRIERISQNTVNVYISHNDLAARNLSFSALNEDSPDYTKLVWDAIDHANIEFGREFDDRQLKVVNKYDSDGCLILTISHNADDNDSEPLYYEEENPVLEHFDKILNAAADSMRKELGMKPNNKETQSEDTKSFRNFFQKINRETESAKKPSINAEPKNEISEEKPAYNANSDAKAPEIKEPAEERNNPLLPDWDIIVFPVFTDMVEFFSKNQNFKRIASSLYGYRGAYYLLIKPNSKNIRSVEKLEALVVDYNATYLPAESFLPLLIERGQVLMETGAISKIIKYFNS